VAAEGRDHVHHTVGAKARAGCASSDSHQPQPHPHPPNHLGAAAIAGATPHGRKPVPRLEMRKPSNSWPISTNEGLVTPLTQGRRRTYLVVRSLDPKRTGHTLGHRWKPALKAFAITFADRMPAAEDR
jgi:hypothetical protein